MADKEKILQDLKRFSLRFENNDSCLKFLDELKWRQGFVCPNCGNINYCKGKGKHSRRCTRCKKEISPTAHTLFHRCRIPLKQAFKIVFLACKYPDISSYELNELIGIRRMTCYHFQKRVRNCDQSETDKYILEKLVETTG